MLTELVKNITESDLVGIDFRGHSNSSMVGYKMDYYNLIYF